MRRVWFSRGIAGVGISARELDRAAFALMIEYVPPVNDKYRMRLRVQPRDADIAARIERHKLRASTIYIDKDAEDADERQAVLTKQLAAGLDAEGAGYMFSLAWIWLSLKKGAVFFEQERAVRISFGSLLDGQEITGDMAELRRVAGVVMAAVDRLAAEIETGAAFESGEVRIYAPGARTKIKDDTKPNTPPSEWGD